MNLDFTGHPLTIGGNPILLDGIEAILKPYCEHMFKRFLDYEPVPEGDQGLVDYIATHTTREIAENMSALAVYWKNEYSIKVYNRAIEYNKQLENEAKS